ncbi:MAG: type II secretion system F family protein [Lachnospiraceae bacterium]|nr:type II secretion system F family protein [Lachnospiraceae bacterium]
MQLADYYKYVSLGVCAFCSIFAGAFTYSVLSAAGIRTRGRTAEFAGLIRGRQRESPVYIRIEEWLRKNGAGYHIGKSIDPGKFVAICSVLGIAGFIVGMNISGLMAVVFGTALFLFLPACMPMLNRSDNRAMLPDIRLIYHSIGVQIKSGVYVTDALAECSASVESRRLRDALSDFYAEMIMRSDVYAALENFRASFDDRYIDSLCITVVQAMESGQAVELLSDIAEQVKDMEEEVFESRKARLDRVLTFSQLLLLGSVLGTALYTCVIYMMSRAVGFRGL